MNLSLSLLFNTSRNFKLVSFLFFVIIFFPMVGDSSVFTQVLLHVIILIMILIFILIFIPGFSYFSKYRFFLIYFIITIISYTIISFVNSPQISYRDLSDFLRPVPYILYFSIPFLFPLSLKEYFLLFKLSLYVLVFQILFSPLVYFPAFYNIVDLFKGRDSEDFVLFHFFRWSGTMGYPSDFTYYLSLYFYFFSLSAIFNINRFKSFIWLIFISICFVFSLSRGGILSVGITFFIYLIFSPTVVKFNFLKFVLYCIPFLLLVVQVSNFNFASSTEFNIDYLINLFNPEDMDDSTAHRLYEMNLAVDVSEEYFPFGVGSSREYLKSKINVIESYYGYLLIKWGFYGLVLNFIFIFYVLRSGLRASLMALGKYNRTYFILLFSLFLFILSVPLVFGFSSDMTSRLKCLPLFYFSCGFLVYIESYLKNT